MTGTKGWILAVLLIAALGVAGCGGSGGGSADTMDPPGTMDPEPTAAEMAATGAADAATDAAAALAGISADDAADAARELASAANDEAQAAATAAATAAEAGDELEARIQERIAQNALADVNKYAMQATADVSAAAHAAYIAKKTKSAETKADAITAEGMQTETNDGGLGGSQEDGTAVDTYSMTIKRDNDGTTVTITDTANPRLADDADEDEVEDPQFALAMDLGGGRTMHSRAMEADADGNVVEEIVIVSTDIEAPKATPFTTVYPLDQREDGTTVVAETAPANTYDLSASALAATDAEQAVILARVASPSFVSGAAAVLTFTQDDDSTADVDEAGEAAGTYDGAMGTYRCYGNDDCTVGIDAKGKIITMSDGWSFTPDDKVTVDVADADFLHYGVWLKKTTDEDGVTTYNEVETFADSSVEASDSVSDVRGSATYTGGAVGVYVHRTFATDGETNATSGHFKADASLTATFSQTTADDVGGADQIAPNMLDTLTGTIDNFELSGGEANRWSVTLSGDIMDSDGTASGTAKGGDPNDDGSYTATFHGPTTDNTQPTSVVGEFNSSFVNGTVAGGFGATIDKK